MAESLRRHAPDREELAVLYGRMVDDFLAFLADAAGDGHLGPAGVPGRRG